MKSKHWFLRRNEAYFRRTSGLRVTLNSLFMPCNFFVKGILRSPDAPQKESGYCMKLTEEVTCVTALDVSISSNKVNINKLYKISYFFISGLWFSRK